MLCKATVTLLASLLLGMVTSEEANAEAVTMYGTSDGYAGQITASGDVMDPSAYTAAHPSLPLGSDVEVCAGDACVVVTVNDRGSMLDLTPAAFAAIADPAAGVVDCAVTPL